MRALVRFFRREKNTDKTKDAAKGRLLVAITYDREESKDTGLIKKLKEELFKVLSGYEEIDGDALEIKIKLENSIPSLDINIPIRRSL